MKSFILIACFVVVALGHNGVTLNDEGQFVDTQGRIRIYHGVNVVRKPPPFYPVTDRFDPLESFSEEDCQYLKKFGFNVIRLHVAFEAAMPVKDQINFEYLQKIKEIVDLAEKYDIQVLLDAHQDLLNRQFCGEGFPDWAVTRSDFPAPQKVELRLDEKGYPLLEDCLQQGFAKYYLTSDVGRNYESILKNENGVADSFALFWKHVATLFKDQKNVIGYDMLNEPVAADWQRSKLDFVWPGWGNKHLIAGFYKIVNAQIRSVDNETLVFFEPYFTDVFGGGFEENIGGPEYKHKEVLNYHVYCGIVDKQGSPTNLPLCEFLHTIFMDRKATNKKHLGTGSFLSEFGASANTEGGKKMLNDLLWKADKHHESWTFWQYKQFGDYTTSQRSEESGVFKPDGSFQENKIEALVRPYAYAICAQELKTNQWDYDAKTFTLEYVANEGCETEIFVPQIVHFTQGFKYKFDNCANCTLTEIDSNTYYRISGQISRGQNIKLTINH